MKFWVFLLLCVLSDIGKPKAQSVQPVRVGNLFATDQTIEGKEYRFTLPVYHLHIDSVGNRLFIQLRDTTRSGKHYKRKGRFLLYNPETEREIWSKSVTFNRISFVCYDDFIFHIDLKKSRCYRISNGNLLWETKGGLVYMDRSVCIGIRINFLRGGWPLKNDPAKLFGLNTGDGKKLWERKFNVLHGVKIQEQNDSTMFVEAGGLHRLNLRTGKGWDYKAVTGSFTEIRTPAELNGVQSWLSKGSFVVIRGSTFITNLSSDVFIDREKIYWASRDKILCLKSENGNIVWEKTLPPGYASSSVLHLQDSLIYMFNLGLGLESWRMMEFGNPFVAGFHKETGKPVFCNVVYDKKEHINDFRVEKGNIWVVYNQRVIQYQFPPDGTIVEKQYHQDSSGNFKRIFTSGIYRQKPDSSYEDFVLADTNIHYIRAEERIIGLDDELNVKKTLDYTDIYVLFETWKEYRFLYGKDGIVVIDRKNRPVAHLDLPQYTEIFQNKIYEIRDHALVIVDLDKYFK